MLARFVTWQQANTHYLLLHASQPIQKPCFLITTSQNHLQVKHDKLPLKPINKTIILLLITHSLTYCQIAKYRHMKIKKP